MDRSVAPQSSTQSDISSDDNNSTFAFDLNMHMTVPWTAPLDQNHYSNPPQGQSLYRSHHDTTINASVPFVTPTSAPLLVISQLSAGEENTMTFVTESDFIYSPESAALSVVGHASSMATTATVSASVTYDSQMCTSSSEAQPPAAISDIPMIDFMTPYTDNRQSVLTYNSFFTSPLEMAGPEQPLATPFLDNASIASCDSDVTHHVAEQPQPQPQPQQQQQQQQPWSISSTTTNAEATPLFADWERQARYPTWRLIRPHRRAYRRRHVSRRDQQQRKASATDSDDVVSNFSSTGPEQQFAAATADGPNTQYRHTTDNYEASADRPQCPECGAFFSRQRDLARHRQTTHSTHRLHCRYCSKSYTRNDSRMRHERQCAGSSLRVAEPSTSTSTSSCDSRASNTNKQPSPPTASSITTTFSSSSSSASSSPILSIA
ncbi:hypothetical protein BX666DRAFT_2087677 [Dichotomocladium elegans]|nr:hypothetical protein BX666DRAFT_2087677 [Dichotomocladium elegans]